MKNEKRVVPALQIVLLLCTAIGCGQKSGQSNTAAQNMEENKNLMMIADTSMEEKNAEEQPKGSMPVISFSEKTHDFGTIKEGEKVSHRYTLKNTGKAPLVIQQARPSCGCTVSAFSKDPIPVGNTGFVEVEFDSQGKVNNQHKTITVTANTSPTTTLLHFKVFVEPKKKSTK